MRATLNRFIAPIVAFALLALYWPVAVVVEDNFQAEVLRAMQGTALTVIFVAFVLKFRRAFAPEVPDSARRFYLGLILWSCAAAGGALWRLLWRMGGGGPELAWMITNDAIIFQSWVETVGIFFMLSGPAIPAGKLGDMEPQYPEDISWKRIIIAATICFTAAYLVVVLRIGSDQIRALLAYLHPG
ncbi:hypothetical protein [Methylobacterium sp. WL19]|uniref:hypothetical protein n=1 Tax=Methylobacterium sp. WL19 TaxID=2603896 RepID=UPI0011CB0565|nr:hypothetical protein [Methylobacterium sp. WL19]TXN33872.1 hypothetical protein FV220_00015 [Methylobacterium sp. WL19]